MPAMSTSRHRDFAALGLTVQVAGETLFELLAFAMFGTVDLALVPQFVIRTGVYIGCLVLLPRLRRRIPFNSDKERLP
jgi:hypothetical protein